MGGGFARGAMEALSDVLSKAYNKAEANSAGKYGIDMLWSMGRSFMNHPTGETVYKMAEEGIRQKTQIATKLLEPVHNFQAEVKKDPKLATMHNYDKTPLMQVHGSLPNNHPAKLALDPLMATPAYHNHALPDIQAMLHSESNTRGREAAFGPNGRNLVATIYPMLTGPSPTERTKAEAWLGILAQIFKDSEPSPTGGMRSAIKSDVVESIKRTHKQLNLPDFKMNRDPEYTGSNVVERFSHKYAMNYLAPFIAVAHLADFYKLGTVPATALYKTLTAMRDPQLQQLKVASGIFFHTMHSIYDNDFRYRTGRVAQKTGLPDAAAMLHKMYHQPFFNNLRTFQLSTMGSAAYHSAQMWGKQAVHGDSRALLELKEMHLDVSKIIARGGDLTDEELSQAIWHFTNNRLFIDKPMDRAALAQKSPFFRVSTMFHGYITKEGMFLTRELSKLARANDYAGLAQFAATVGVVFPATAPLLYSLETLIRTGSPDKAKANLDDDYKHLVHPEGVKDFLGEYLTLLGHFGAAGAFMQYLHSAQNHKLAAALIGPVPGVVTGTIEDIYSGVKGGKTDVHNYRPFERDVLKYYTIPIFGTWVSEQMIPKGHQNVSSGLELSSRSRRRGRR